VFSKKISTRGESKERDSFNREKDNLNKVIKKSASNKEVLNFRSIKTSKGSIDIPKLDLNVCKPKENERKLVQSKSFVNE